MATDKTNLGGGSVPAHSGSDLDPIPVAPGSKADPSTKPAWNDHVEEYFNQETTHGEPIPTATHEAKDPAPSQDRVHRSEPS